jgi:hypothetical protein
MNAPLDEPARRLLWDRLRDFDFDGGRPCKVSFTGRLARENGWSLAQARRVVDEYRRFVFLARTAGHPVTPSETVDQAWHLHLTYTRSYWDELCGRVLGAPLHHVPTTGGPGECALFDQQYRATLASYARLCGASPPADIWPSPEIRFGADLAWRRVWTSRSWIVPKRAAAAALALLAVLSGFALWP